MGAALPRFRFTIAAGALICAMLASGCTSTDLGLEPQASFATTDPVLPDTVDTVPAFASDASTDTVVPTAFAGPTPDSPAAAVLLPGKTVAARSPELDALIVRYAAHHEIPVSLLRRVVERESTFNPVARNGPYWGLMQILPQTARTMGYRGTPEGLLDAETNLMYAGRYLRGAYITADGNHDLAVRYYSRGYYYDAKRRGLLEETGLRPARTRMAKAS